MIKVCRCIISILMLIFHNYYAQLPFSLGQFPNNNGVKFNHYESRACVDKVKVGNNRPVSCTYSDVWYPVIYETFDNYDVRELLNNYSFRYEFTEYDLSYYGNEVYYGNAFDNGNVYLESGNLVLEIKKETGKDYEFTNALLRSLYKTKWGAYFVRVKYPNNIYTWPAFWVHYGSAQNHDYEEIDWCEFFDNCPSKDNWLCNKGGRYSWMRMNILNKEPDGSDFCSRSTYIDVGNNFFNSYHEFGGIWTEYKVFFFLDGIPQGVATKFSSTDLLGFKSCDASRPYYFPKYCSNMFNEPECLQYAPWPFQNTCLKWNWVFNDVYYPHRPLQTLITCGVNLQKPPDGCPESSFNGMINKWTTFSDEQKKTKIDYLLIFQPIKCYTDYTVLNEPHFKSITGGTNFLSGRKLTISNGVGNNLYINESPKASNNWHEFPTHILATEEIAFLNEVAFEEGTFLRAEIINCNTGISNISQKMMGGNTDTLPPVLPIDYFDQQDSTYIALQNYYNSPLTSETDNGALQVFPNPTSTHFHISMAEEDFNDLKEIEIVDMLGRVKELPISEVQDISEFAEGVYMVKFYFSTGMLVVKSLVIKR